jgi:ligand-binding sensor domain-containing protein
VKRFSVLIFVFLLSYTGSAQTYQFFNYGLSEGLCDKFAYALNQDPQGFLWVSTSQGLCRFDGQVFDQDFKGDSIPVSIAHASLLDSKGRLWFGYENGLLSVYNNGVFRLISPGENNRSIITAIREDGSGNMMVMYQQTGLLVIDEDLNIIYERDPEEEEGPFSGMTLYDFQVMTDGTLLVGGSSGVTLFRYDNKSNTFINNGLLDELRYKSVQELVKAVNDNEFWAGTQDEGMYRITGSGNDPAGYQVEQIGEELGLGLEYANIASIVFDGDRRVWINSMGEGIYRFDLDESGNLEAPVLFNEEKGIPDVYIDQIFIDEEGNQWFSSSAGNGISVLRNEAFTFFNVWEMVSSVVPGQMDRGNIPTWGVQTDYPMIW